MNSLALRISILIPTKNRLAFVLQAIQSVLAQSYRNIEVIVSDNWSEDGTHESICKIVDSRLRIVRPDAQLPMTENWNHALSFATGDYFLLLSDDDELSPDGIEALVTALDVYAIPTERNFVVIGRVQVINGADEVTGYSRTGATREAAQETVLGFLNGIRGNYPCGNLLHTETTRAAGGYDGKLYGVGADGALWINLAFKCGSVIHAEKVVSRYRTHTANATSATSISDWLLASMATRSLIRSRCSQDILPQLRLRSAGRSHSARLLCGLAAVRSLQTLHPFRAFVAELLPHRKHLFSFEGYCWLLLTFIRIFVHSTGRRLS